MNQLELAEMRLAKALGALEQAAATARAEHRLQVEPGRETLEQERDRLLARIAQLEEDLAALGSVNQEVESRLDGAISEIRAALAG